MEPPYRIQTISQFHKLRDRPEPAHPLISILNVTGTRLSQDAGPTRLVFDFYTITFKSVQGGTMKYGQQLFDYDSGMMGFSSPGQVISVDATPGEPAEQKGWLLLVHPDFLWNTPPGEKDQAVRVLRLFC